MSDYYLLPKTCQTIIYYQLSKTCQTEERQLKSASSVLSNNAGFPTKSLVIIKEHRKRFPIFMKTSSHNCSGEEEHENDKDRMYWYYQMS